MTDKVQKIRAEIERRYNEYMAKDSELAAIRADECLGILSYIDSMQEEPTIPDIVDEHWWEMLGEEPVSEEQVKESLISKHDDKTCKEKGNSLTQEIVSEDLKKCTSKIIFEGTNFNKSWYAHPELAFKAGAKWQIAKLMANATEVTVHIDAGGYPYIPQIELYDYDKDITLAKEGEKYKVVLIKEE